MNIQERLAAAKARAAAREAGETPPTTATAGPKPKKQAPPRVDQLPGVRLNSPEAPSTVDEKQTVSQVLGERLTGSPKKDKAIAREVAVEARTGGVALQVDDPTDETPNPGNADIEFDPKKTDGNLILQLCKLGWDTFTVKRDKATRRIPFAHGKTLKKLISDGLVTVEEKGILRTVRLTESGADEQSMHAPNVEVPEPIANTRAGGMTTEEMLEKCTLDDYKRMHFDLLKSTGDADLAVHLLTAQVAFDQMLDAKGDILETLNALLKE